MLCSRVQMVKIHPRLQKIYEVWSKKTSNRGAWNQCCNMEVRSAAICHWLSPATGCHLLLAVTCHWLSAVFVGNCDDTGRFTRIKRRC